MEKLEQKNNYYTPEIEEFHIGFEYEWLNDQGNWVKENTPIEISINAFREQIYGLRVKYLDQEDIESFGFEFEGKSVDMWFEKNTQVELSSWASYKVYLQYGIQDKRCVIELEDTGDKHRVFEGILKNKSELEKVLKMIGVIKDE